MRYPKLLTPGPTIARITAPLDSVALSHAANTAIKN